MEKAAHELRAVSRIECNLLLVGFAARGVEKEALAELLYYRCLKTPAQTSLPLAAFISISSPCPSAAFL